jgi:hypothetical protein
MPDVSVVKMQFKLAAHMPAVKEDNNRKVIFSKGGKSTLGQSDQVSQYLMKVTKRTAGGILQEQINV